MEANACVDRFAIWPIALAGAFPLVLIVLWSGPFGLTFAGVPILLAVWSGSALLALGMAAFSAGSHFWRRALSLSVLPLVTLVAIANASTLWSFAIEAGERLHFQVMRRGYLEDVSKLPRAGEPRFVVWLWGGFGVGRGVVYDESDEIALPEQSQAWKQRVANTEVGMCGVWGKPVGNHFYLVRTGC